MQVFPILIFFIGAILATANDFPNVRIYASAPLTYTHETGGGAINDQTVGRDLDVVSSLEGGDFKCNDLVSYLVYIEVKPNPVDASQCLTMGMTFTADSTGQPGVAFGDVPNFVVNRGMVENGANGTPVGFACVCNGNPGRGKFGTDCFNKANGNEVNSFLERRLTAPLFTANDADLKFKIKTCGLEAGEVVVVRFDVKIFCLEGTSPTGNLQGAFDYAQADDGTIVTGGQQTIPLKNVNRIVGTSGNCTPNDGVPITGPDFNSTITVYSPDMQNGGSVVYNFWYSWSLGMYKTQSVANPYLIQVNNFDTLCSFMHDGTTLYSDSVCGCEATFIPVTQPQLFFNVNSTYYNPNPTTETINGISVLHYTRASTASAITDLYVLVSNPSIVYKAVFENGEYWIFSNVVLGKQSASSFSFPSQSTTSTCTCKRPVDIEIVVQRDASVTCTDFGYVIQAAKNFVDGFEVSSTNNQAMMGVIYYDTTAVQKLPIKSGTNALQVKNSLGSIGCVGATKDPAGTNLNPGGLLSGAIDKAIADLRTSGRSYPQAILIIANGYTEPRQQVIDAVARANALGIKVFALAYQSYMVQSEQYSMVDSTNKANLVYRIFSSDLATKPLIDIISRMCLANTKPCGEFCCGTCDSVCGKCIPVSQCPTTSNCSVSYVIQNNCCVPSPAPSCTPPVGTCQDSICNAQTGQCELKNNCGVGALDTACFTYACIAGTCTKQPKFADTNCTKQDCFNNAIRTQPIACPTNTACFTYTCVEARGGCVSSPTPDNSANAGDNCYTHRCTLPGGWVSTLKDCSNGDTCNPGTCVNGTCINTPINCKADLNNLCDTSRCTNGVCVNSSVICTPANSCETIDPTFASTGGCNPGLGTCSFVKVFCSPSGNCYNQTRQCVGGSCVCLYPPPPPSPTRAPTTGTNPTPPPTVPPPLTCTCQNDGCVTSTCLIPANNTCAPPVTLNCTALIPDTCTQVTGPCNPAAGGCQFGPVAACTPSADPCSVVIRDPSFPGCCKTVPTVCGGGCYSYTCTAGTCDNGTYLCVNNPSDLCNTVSCDGTRCVNTSITCPLPDACQVGTCNPATGLCVYSAIDCDDGLPCTDDTCHPVNGCQHTPVVCPTASSRCNVVVPCDPVTGFCGEQPIVCDDNITCTIDTCDDLTGCVFTPTQSLCAGNPNPCVASSVCDPTNAVDSSGCVTTPLVCPGESANLYCSSEVCEDYQGCVSSPRDCIGNLSNTSCDTYNCSEPLRTCELIAGVCFNFLGAVVGGIVAGAIVGIIIAAIILALVFAGGGAYAVSQAINAEHATQVVNNPMYESQGRHRDNPLQGDC